MTLLYYDPIFLEHDTGTHPERAQRLVQVTAHLRRIGLWDSCRHATWEDISPERLKRIHKASYISQVEQFALHGGGRIEADTVVCPKSYSIALKAAGAVCDAVDQVLSGKDRQAFCLLRPPGHHALHDQAMGFCLFNNVALGARNALAEHRLNRVLIIDWDVHHGNGTQDAFWTDPQVGFLSIHRWPFYPGTGAADETGEGAGKGTTLNLPIEFGTSRKEYLDQFRRGVEQIAKQMKPELILISAGFDAHRDDPIGSLELESEDFQTLSSIVLETADQYAQGRVVSVLEGGYNPSALAGSVELHLRELLRREEARKKEQSSPQSDAP